MKFGLTFAAVVLTTALAAPARVGNSPPKCRKLGERCAGATNNPSVESLGCCGVYPDVDCLPHPDAATDESKSGHFCQSSETKYQTSLATKSVSMTVTGASMTAAKTSVSGTATKVPGSEPMVKPSPERSGNPISGVPLYVMPSFSEDIDSSIANAEGKAKASLEKARDAPTAFWLDKMYKVKSDNSSLEALPGILSKAANTGQLATFIVYDLPNRDCHAKASNGEICCGKTNPDGTCDYLDAVDGQCEDGLAQYKAKYIDEIATSVSKYCEAVPMVLVIEPDSLGNLVTNTDDPKCGSTATKYAYEQGISYAVKTLNAACPAATIYLDGAHGGWLGWENNLSKFSAIIKSLGIHALLRGFANNVSNYQPVGIPCPSVGHCVGGGASDDACCEDPCGLSSEYNLGHNEMNYAAALAGAMKAAMPDFDAKMLIDTSRNGQPGTRQQCSNWCNARGAGFGLLPTTETGSEHVDALMWLKTPGESDGCTEELPSGGTCPRFDADCASIDSIGTKDGEPRAPEAGGWFEYQIQMLASNAKME